MPDHLDLGQDGQGDLGRFPATQVEADGPLKAAKLVFREPLIPQMFQDGPDFSLAPDHAQISGQGIMNCGRRSLEKRFPGRVPAPIFQLPAAHIAETAAIWPHQQFKAHPCGGSPAQVDDRSQGYGFPVFQGLYQGR